MKIFEMKLIRYRSLVAETLGSKVFSFISFFFIFFRFLFFFSFLQIEPIPSGNLPPGFDPSTCRSVWVLGFFFLLGIFVHFLCVFGFKSFSSELKFSVCHSQS